MKRFILWKRGRRVVSDVLADQSCTLLLIFSLSGDAKGYESPIIVHFHDSNQKYLENSLMFVLGCDCLIPVLFLIGGRLGVLIIPRCVATFARIFTLFRANRGVDLYSIRRDATVLLHLHREILKLTLIWRRTLGNYSKTSRSRR